MQKTYAHPSNARRAARAALGKDAIEGTDYRLTHQSHGIGFEIIPKKHKKQGPKPRPATDRLNTFAKTAGPGKRSRKPTKAADGASKPERLAAMLARPQGATALEVGEEFGWLEHTARARISTMLRPLNIKVERTREERTGYEKPIGVYRAEPQLPLGESREALGTRTRRAERPAR